jgi:hypothetical protein
MRASVFRTKYNEDLWLIEGSPLYEGSFWQTLISGLKPTHREIVVHPYVKRDGSKMSINPPVWE